MEQNFINNEPLEEARLYYQGVSSMPQVIKDLCSDFENEEGSAFDLRALNIFLNSWDRGRVRLARKGESMPKTGIWVNEEGKYCSEHYSSKPGLETYGFASFDTPQELFRHIWLRVVKNGIPASLMSKRNVNEKIDFDTMFPPGRGLTMPEILDELKPMLGGEKLAHPSNEDLLQLSTIQRLISLGLIGKKSIYKSGEEPTVVRDLTKGGKIKYYFYCTAIQDVMRIYKDVISEIAGVGNSSLLGRIFNTFQDYEAWTVTNTQRMPINSVNFRTGENILVCRLQEVEMFSAVFVAIIKRTFKRAKGKKVDEKLISPSWRLENTEAGEIINELNDLLSDYFYEAASQIDPVVFVENSIKNEIVYDNARALLIKYLLEKGSLGLKKQITTNPKLQEYVELTTKHPDLDELTKKLIRVSKALRFME